MINRSTVAAHIQYWLDKTAVARRPVAHLHIPKTGGTYIGQYETDGSSVIPGLKNLGHTCILDDSIPRVGVYPPPVFSPNPGTPLSVIKSYFVMATVRNPFSWLVSYAAHAGGWHPKYHDVDHYDFQIANRGFDYLVNTIAQRDDDTWPNRRLIFFQAFCDNGQLIVDWINQTESLDEDLAALAKYRKVGYRTRAKQRVGKHEDYRSYYTDKLIDLVSTTWRRELELFGYNFDGPINGVDRLYRNIKPHQKSSIEYFWGQDKLLVDGLLVK